MKMPNPSQSSKRLQQADERKNAFVAESTITYAITPTDEAADTLSICLFALFHRMGLSADELRTFMQHLYAVHDDIKHGVLTIEDIKTSLSEGGAGIPVDVLYPRKDAAQEFQEALREDPFMALTVNDLEKQIEVLKRLRNETNPKNYIGLWGYNDSAHQYNIVTTITSNLSKLIKIKKLKNEA